MARILSVASAVAAIFLGCALTASAAVTTNETQPLSSSIFVPCAAGGVGEVVDLTGSIHVLRTTTVTGNVVNGTEHFQPQGVRGVGEITGSTYEATGVTQQHFSFQLDGGHGETSFVNTVRVIGHGGVPSFSVHETTHMAMASDGTLTVTHDTLSVDCG
jgi:hypothetical protein